MKHSKKQWIAILMIAYSIGGVFAQQQKEELFASAATKTFPTETFPIEEESFFLFESSEINPSDELYQFWTNERVNPYNVAIRDIPDSVRIDCSDYFHPIEGECVVTSNFGHRRGRFHYGIDLRVKVGQDVYAAFDGKVRVTGYDKYGYGYFVVVRHNNGFETVYGHLSKIIAEDNQEVKAGDLIALGGNTGRSTGPHLHLEFRYLGNPINPKKIIDFNSYDYPVPAQEFYLVCKKTSFEEYHDYNTNRPKYYVVKSGDTLSSIARKNGTTVDKLCRLNKISSSSVIRVSQRIRCF